MARDAASDQARRLSRWLDTLDIREALAEHNRAMAANDAERAGRVFLEDANEDHGPVNGNARQLAVDFIANARDEYAVTVRHILDARVEVDGDRAISEAAWFNILQGGGDDMFYVGRYLDRWERRDGAWKIAARVTAVDWWRYEPRNDRRFFEGAEAILGLAGRGFDDHRIRDLLGLSGKPEEPR